MNRVAVAELLDTDSGSDIEVQDSLADLQWINRVFGGISTTTDLLLQVAERKRLETLSFLDVAGATGDVAAAASQRLRERGVQLQCMVADRSISHLAKQSAVAADAFHLPFADESFDVVGSALFLHHLEPSQITVFLRESLRVSRHACIVNDLRRSRLHLAAATAGRLLYRSPITSHDAVASVRRAYTANELREMLRGLPASEVTFSNHFLFRLGVILWK